MPPPKTGSRLVSKSFDIDTPAGARPLQKQNSFIITTLEGTFGNFRQFST